MVDVYAVSMTKSQFEEKIEELGGEITHESGTFEFDDTTIEEIEVYFDELTPELEEELEDLVADKDDWWVSLSHDPYNGGVMFERELGEGVTF